MDRRIALAVIETIYEESKDQPIPSSVIYAALMGLQVPLLEYQLLLDGLKKSRLITVDNHLIRWIGPRVESGAVNP